MTRPPEGELAELRKTQRGDESVLEAVRGRPAKGLQGARRADANLSCVFGAPQRSRDFQLAGKCRACPSELGMKGGSLSLMQQQRFELEHFLFRKIGAPSVGIFLLPFKFFRSGEEVHAVLIMAEPEREAFARNIDR